MANKHWTSDFLKQFPQWFFYCLIFAPGIFYLEKIAGEDLLAYQGVLILILLIKSVFHGFIYMFSASIWITALDAKANGIVPVSKGAFWTSMESMSFAGTILFSLSLFGLTMVSYYYIYPNYWIDYIILNLVTPITVYLTVYHKNSKRK